MSVELALLAVLVGSVSAVSGDDWLPIPPPMAKRAISKRSDPWPGQESKFVVDGKEWTLFIPNRWRPRHTVDLCVHFHGAVWHAIQEHLDRGLKDPLLVFYPGEGSTVYREAVEDPSHFERLLSTIKPILEAKGLQRSARWGAIDVTSFSAGYGAVREWIRQPEVFKRLRRVVLGDSLYGSLTEGVDGRVPLWEHIVVWQPLVDAAVAGRKTFAVTVSEVPTPSYASSLECATALIEMARGKALPVTPGDLPATLDLDFPLKARFDKGNFHVWMYAGTDAQAHMTHARHIADVWKSLDRAPVR